MTEPELCVVGGGLGRNNESATNKHWNWRLQVNGHLKPHAVHQRLYLVLNTADSIKYSDDYALFSAL